MADSTKKEGKHFPIPSAACKLTQFNLYFAEEN